MTASVLLADARIDGRAELARLLACDAALPDEELILRAYAHWGDDAPGHLLGDYAFALRDGQRLFAARDHAGVRPLFYAESKGGLLVASTIRELLAQGVSGELDDRGIATFLIGGTYEDPIATSFAAVKRLPAAHTLTWSAEQGVVTRRYWSPPVDGVVRYPREEQYVDHFRAVFDEAIADRLRGSKASALMSGGLDSTAVAATAQRQLMARHPGSRLHAWTLSYQELLRDEEPRWAARVALPSLMTHDVIDRDGVKLFENLPWRDEPYDDPLAAPFLQAAARAAAVAPVLFTGQGGDAVFYTSHGHFRDLLRGFRLAAFVGDVAAYARRHRALPPLNLRSAVKAWAGIQPWTPALPPWVRREWIDRFDLARPFAAPAIERVHPLRPEAQRILLDPNWSLLFEAWHRGQTGLDLDVVYPYFDRRVVELLLAYPPMPFFARKQLLREAMRGRLPDEVRRRPKTPLPASPLRLQMQAERERLLALLEASPELERWIDRKRLADALRRGTGDGYSDYLAILPFCVGGWLASRT
jgi:asparagine synthase (glutamine-hydrolysing)